MLNDSMIRTGMPTIVIPLFLSGNKGNDCVVFIATKGTFENKGCEE
jgi:hypothetical protein